MRHRVTQNYDISDKRLFKQIDFARTIVQSSFNYNECECGDMREGPRSEGLIHCHEFHTLHNNQLLFDL